MATDAMALTTTEAQQAQEYYPGEIAPAIITSAQMWKPDDIRKEDPSLLAVFNTLCDTVSNTDEAARRFSVLQCWQERHFDRGYQYLEGSQLGGWNVIGAGSGLISRKNTLSEADDANLYPTNIYSAQGDIVTSAVNRGQIKVNFTPKRSKFPLDVKASDAANSYKHLWYEANDGENLQRTLIDLGWTDPRAIAWTRSIADCSRFGYLSDGKTPRSVEVSSLFGVLESKTPMMADTLDQMSYVQLFEEIDYAIARASYPWMGKKIMPSWGVAGEVEFERIARINTRIGIVGKYITGTSGIRETTMSYNWFRPGMYYDQKITDQQRDWLLKSFPKGLFCIMAGKEMCCCWEEAMDDVLSLAMFCRGFGQNRRALGSSDLPLQKRINIWADLWDKFVRGAIPLTALESNAFDAEAIGQLESSPTRFISVALAEGDTMERVIGQIPASNPIPGMFEAFQYYVGPLVQAVDGGVPALFGEGEGEDNTVGATQIRLEQSLQRHNRAWMVANRVFEEMNQQAARLCAMNSTETLESSIEEVGEVSVEPADLKGEFKCKAETINLIPQTGAQREAKVLEILDMAQKNMEIASIVATPSNAREIVKALHIDDVITVDEANWEDCALEDIEALLDSEPLINPQYAQLQQQLGEVNDTHEQAKALALTATQSGEVLDPSEIEQGQQLEDQVNALGQQLQQTPQYLPSIPVADDDSEDHATLAATAFAWMGETDGRQLRRAARKEQPGGDNWKKWTNVFLYWQGHKQMAEKFSKPQAQQPKISITGKLDPQQQAQILGMTAGIQTSPQSLIEPHEAEQETIQRTPFAEVKTRIKRRL